MNYTHLIVSRVNIKWFSQSKDISWLDNRIKILDSTLRPSIINQTNKNFKFVTLWGYEPIGGIDNEIQLKLNCDISKGENLYNEMIINLQKYIDEENVLVTRIDSDNCLSNDFVENIQKNITSNIPYYYDIKKMNIINLNTMKKSIWNISKTSGFISVMEKKDNFKCIPYAYDHSDIGKYYDGITIDDLNVLLTIHGDNLSVKENLGQIGEFDLNKYNLKIK
jgi:hypothetical protein